MHANNDTTVHNMLIQFYEHPLELILIVSQTYAIIRTENIERFILTVKIGKAFLEETA